MNLLTIPDRSDCIHYANGSDRTLIHYGEGFLYESLPKDTRVIYPPSPIAPISDYDTAIEAALENPMGCDPLSAQLKPGMKVTIAFDDISMTLPQMQRPDLRQIIITKVLEKLAAAGVTDIHLIAAIALHRKMTPRELKYCLGRKIFNQFYPTGQLYNYDAEDPDANIEIGTTPHGEVVEVSRRAVESDLVIYVNINTVSQGGGNKSFSTGLSTYRTIKSHHNVRTLMKCESYMDPENSALHNSCNRMGKIIENAMNIFKIETTINNASMPGLIDFVQKPYWQFNEVDKLAARWASWSLGVWPETVKWRIFQETVRSPYGMTSVQAGKTNLVHEKTLQHVYEQQLIPLQGQSDILIAGVPFLGPYNVNSILNPILFTCLTLGYFFNFYRNKPLIRKGGVMILPYPLHERFHTTHHPSYVEFYERVLPHTTDAKTIEDKYEEEFATNPKYIDLYRNSYAFHGVHPLYMWYWSCYGLDYVGKVIVVKPKSKRAAQVMGFDTADSIEEAVEMAKDVVGENPSISNFHLPPFLVCDMS